MKKVIALCLCAFILLSSHASYSEEVSFTLEDRDRIIRVEAKLTEIDKRFEEIDKRFEYLMTFLWILATVFVAITSVTIAFAFWDRRTALKPIEDRVVVNENKLSLALQALRKLAAVDKKVYAILKEFNLL